VRRLRIVFFQSNLVLLYFLHPIVAEGSLAAYGCTAVGPRKSFLTSDMTVDCDSTQYKGFLAFNTLFLCGYVFGAMVGIAVFLMKMRRHLREEDNAWRAILGFLTRGFFPRFFYWDVLITLRKIVVVVNAGEHGRREAEQHHGPARDGLRDGADDGCGKNGEHPPPLRRDSLGNRNQQNEDCGSEDGRPPDETVAAGLHGGRACEEEADYRRGPDPATAESRPRPGPGHRRREGAPPESDGAPPAGDRPSTTRSRSLRDEPDLGIQVAAHSPVLAQEGDGVLAG
jgi:hypothetical protein